MPLSVTDTYTQTGKTVAYTVMDLKSVNYNLSNIDSSNRAFKKHLGQRWSFSLETPPLLRSEAFEIYRIHQRKNRLTGTIAEDFVPPVLGTKSGTASGTVTVQLVSSTNPTYDFTKGTKTIPVNGTATGTLKKGDFIKFSDHSKVYQLTSDTNLDGSSVDTISIFPGLLQTLTSGATVTYNNVPFQVTNLNDNLEIEMDIDGYFKYKLDLIENI